MTTLKKSIYRKLRQKRFAVPLLAVILFTVILLFASPFIPQVQSTAQQITAKHPTLARIVPEALRPPDVSLPSSGDWLVIPQAEIKMPIVEGPSINVLIKYVGVWHETGDIAHNYVIAGHKLQYFRSVNQSLYHLNTVKAGDTDVYVILGGIVHRYRVASTGIVSPYDVAILNPTATAKLTIYTCNDFFNHSRFVVTAMPV